MKNTTFEIRTDLALEEKESYPVFRRSTRKVPTFSFSYLIPLFP